MLSIIIPVYKNKTEFLRNLQHNLPFFAGCEVIVVNDDPTESLQKDMPAEAKIVLIENETNLGFGQTVHKGIKEAKNDYVMLLNSDVILNDVKFLTALDHFKKSPLLFAVSFAQKERDGSLVGKNSIYWTEGFFQHKKSPDIVSGKNGWAEGGTCIIDKTKFTKLGGVDPLYSPFYWEDVDLSYRAWKSGYEILFDPEVVMIHHHESTIGKYFSKNFVKTIAFRNQLIFIWKNITDSSLLREHLTILPKTLLAAVVTGEFWKVSGFFQALMRISKIIEQRKIQKKMFIKSDREVLSISGVKR